MNDNQNNNLQPELGSGLSVNQTTMKILIGLEQRNFEKLKGIEESFQLEIQKLQESIPEMIKKAIDRYIQQMQISNSFTKQTDELIFNQQQNQGEKSVVLSRPQPKPSLLEQLASK